MSFIVHGLSTNWNECTCYIPHITAPITIPLFIHDTRCLTCLHTFSRAAAVFTSLSVSIHFYHTLLITVPAPVSSLFMTHLTAHLHLHQCPYMTPYHPTATMSMLSFQRQKERKKLEREEKMEDASEQVRTQRPKWRLSFLLSCYFCLFNVWSLA